MNNPAERYRWFAVAFYRNSAFILVAQPASSYGLYTIYSSQDKGINLTDGKTEDEWKVDFTTTGVTFQNASIQIQLIK